jgi:predicted dithiol-disulfide oxidoreductase (DUF899 family)
VAEDYVFERIGADERPEQVHLSELFGKHPSIVLYSFMYGPERDQPCTGCTHTIDGWDGSVYHADQRFPTYVVAKSPIARLEAPGQHHRAGDLVDPVWGLLDMSPEGRGDFDPKLSY